MLPTPTRLEVAAEILSRIEQRRRMTGDHELGSDLEHRLIQRELDLLELEWLGHTEQSTSEPKPQRKWRLFDRWFGHGNSTLS